MTWNNKRVLHLQDRQKHIELIFEQSTLCLPYAYHANFIIWCIVASICCLLCFSGCTSSNAQDSQESDTTVEPNMTVSLSNVQPPAFRERFAVMYYNNDAVDVMWGMAGNTITDGCFVMDSSYPGFGHTVIIKYDYFNSANEVTLATLYGTYEYLQCCSYNVFTENGSLVNGSNGEKVNRLDANNERLVIYSSVNDKAFEYKLKEGTKIIIE